MVQHQAESSAMGKIHNGDAKVWSSNTHIAQFYDSEDELDDGHEYQEHPWDSGVGDSHEGPLNNQVEPA
jgi:hypothetical protein